jgi:hypothetical protein
MNSYYIIFYLFSFLLLLKQKFAPRDVFVESHSLIFLNGSKNCLTHDHAYLNATQTLE